MNLDSMLSNLKQDMQNVYEWFVSSSMKANPDKCQFIILENTGSHTFQIGDINIKSASSVALLSISIDSELNFKENIDNIVKTHIIKA